jgi:hypothetical protein
MASVAASTRQTKAGQIFRLITFGSAVKGLLAASVSETKIGKHTNNTTTDTYYLRRIPSEIGGIAIEVEKTGDAEVRHVLLNALGGGHSCTCKWGSYAGHKKACRHIETCFQAIREGKL